MAEDNQLIDQSLLERAWSGDGAAKEDLVRKYVPMVHRIVRTRATRRSDHYEDLCQEGLIGLLKAIGEYDPGRYAVKFSTFAYICILRRVSNVVKQAQTKKRRMLANAIPFNCATGIEDYRQARSECLPAAGVDPLDVVLGNWTEERIRVVLQVHLSRVEFVVVDLLLKGMTTAEIQTELGLAAKVVDNARTRARLKLRRLMQQYGSLLNPELPLRAKKRLDLAMDVRVG